MASDEHAPGFVPGRGYTQADWDEVSDTPEITDEQWAASRPLVEVMPELVAAMERRRGPQKAPTKDLVSLRLDKDVLATLRAGGSGWQSRANEVLRKGLGLDPAASDVEERLDVGKRSVSRGRVTLHSETVSVDRRPVDRPVLAAEIRDDMEVVGSDGMYVGTVDHMDGVRIKLKKADAASSGEHHYLTHDMVRSVAGKVMLVVTAAEAERRLLTHTAP